jgi:adenine-specific DNA-methyltransferase
MDKHQIENALKNFYSSGLTDASIKLFETLGYNTSRNAPLPTPDYGAFSETFQVVDTRFRPDRARTDEWDYVDLLFQITNDEIGHTISLFDNIQVNNTLIESYLFITVGLKENNYTRTVLSEITREINRIFPMPVMVLFKYDNLLTLSIIDRRINKSNSDRDVLEKVTLIKDIDIQSPHRAHIEILYDLSFQELYKKYQFTHFVKLHESWQITLDTKTLSKKFFDELADWFFWAHNKVTFPNDRNLLPKNNIQISLIRLVTRMIFVWFLKEKKLVPETLFDQNFIKNLLKGFNPDSSKSSVFYNAILQNLFFATLNQKMTERKFASEGDFEENKKEYGVKTLFRHANLFTRDREFVLSLFKDIPFLNGGLFDCLDKSAEDSGKILYTDGFTRKPEKSAKVLDILFWGKEDSADLTNPYGE